MRLVMFLAHGQVRVGSFSEQGVDELTGFGSIASALESWLDDDDRVKRAIARRWGHKEVRLLPPVDRPSRVFAIAQNYPTHAAELGGERPPPPVIFLKLTSALVGPDCEVELPSLSNFFDYEGEVGVVIGRRCRDVPADRALDYVAGYTVCNDGSARDLQETTLGRRPIIDWFSAEALDNSSPAGPWIVTRDDVPDPQNLRLQTRLNGETVQDDRTSSMVFSVAEQIAYISHRLALQPGDLIESGTPGGVGKARGRALPPGDEIEIDVERVGVLRNRYVAAGRGK